MGRTKELADILQARDEATNLLITELNANKKEQVKEHARLMASEAENLGEYELITNIDLNEDGEIEITIEDQLEAFKTDFKTRYAKLLKDYAEDQDKVEEDTGDQGTEAEEAGEKTA